MIASIERAKALIEATKIAKAAKQAAEEAGRLGALNLQKAEELPAAPVIHAAGMMQWNEEQQMAINHGFYGKSFCLIGPAGTGKTTTLKAILANMLEHHCIPPLEQSTKHMLAGAPGVALISYTRRAVRNIAKQMGAQLKPHCITYHKLVEYEPFYYSEWNPVEGMEVKKMRFQPARNRMNPLPKNLKLIVVDEASMLSIDYFNELLEALPNPSQVQFIFLGDLNQLPPVYGQAILGKMLLQLPIIELTRVYRQALESPIIAAALAVKDNNFDGFYDDCARGVFDIENYDEKNKPIG
jgi:ATP-dependent exoDNAse (exonuclease V) alpha subunit